MKQTIRIIQFAFALIFVTTLAQAQFTNIGVGLAYGSEISKPGIIVNAQYGINEKWAITPSFIFYTADKHTASSNAGGFNYKSESKSTVWELNADANYYFFDESGVKLFGIGGLNVTGVKSKVTTTSNSPQFPSSEYSASDTNLGINLGIGADFKAGDKIIPFATIKYTASSFDQLVLYGGVRFILK